MEPTVEFSKKFSFDMKNRINILACVYISEYCDFFYINY